MKPRRILKGCVYSVCLLLAAVPIFVAWLEKRLGGSEAWFGLFCQAVALVPGPPGVYLRAAWYCGTLDHCDWEVHFGYGTLMTHRDAKIASHVSTGAYCVLGHVDIERGVRLASRVSIPSGKRQHLDDSGALSSGTVFERVRVGAGCWIGEGAILLADVGAESIVSAGAVVVGAMPRSSLIGGNPARVLRNLPTRDQEWSQLT